MIPFNTDLAETDAEQLLLEWYQQWEASDDMPTKMADGLHVRTALYWQLKAQGKDTTPTTDKPSNEIPGHEIETIEVPTIGNYRQLTCTCGWRIGCIDTEVENSKQLHWIAKKIEREALDNPKNSIGGSPDPASVDGMEE